MASLTNNFQFIDRSFANPTSWAWDFGDGLGTSIAQNPSYSYPTSGPAVYVPRLVSTAANVCGGQPATDEVWHAAPVIWYLPLINGQWLPGSATVSYQSMGGTATIVTTEAAAIAMLLASSTWSGWLTKSGKSSCCASYQISAGTTFAYYQAQWEVLATGLTPNTAYFFYLQTWQSPYAASTYTKTSVTLYSATTDGSGNFALSGYVPVTRGCDTFAYLINTP